MSDRETQDIYLEEASSMMYPIEGVGTSTVAFIGYAVMGPSVEPTLITSWDQFENIFGGLDYSRNGSYLAIAVDLFFKNLGQRAYVVRVETTIEGTGINGTVFRKGLQSLERLDDVDLVVMPDGTNVSDQIALIEHCEKMRYRFAIIDSPQDPTEVGDSHDVRQQREKLISSKGYAAIYYPWIQVQEPKTQMIKIVPPCGAVAGIFARADAQKGVHKAPSNELVMGALDTEISVDQADMNDLNRIGVNVIRKFAGRGLLVWGSRTISSDSQWKYVQVRRTVIFLERSICKGTEWVVFEPNDERTWSEIKRPILDFLTGCWKDGKLLGNKPEEAFIVRCDRTTMTQKDIDDGKLIVEVGVALVRPAEFVIFRVEHMMEKVGPRSLIDGKLDPMKKKKHWYSSPPKR